MSDWHVHCDDAVYRLPAGLYPIFHLHSLYDYQVHIGLGYPVQRGIQSPITSVPDILGSETDQCLFLSPPDDLPPILVAVPVLCNIPDKKSGFSLSPSYHLPPSCTAVLFILPPLCTFTSCSSRSCPCSRLRLPPLYQLHCHGVLYSALVPGKVAWYRGFTWMILAIPWSQHIHIRCCICWWDVKNWMKNGSLIFNVYWYPFTLIQSGSTIKILSFQWIVWWNYCEYFSWCEVVYIPVK